MRRALAVIWICSFASALVSRVTDPVVPQIAADLGVEVRSAALLSAAFALPWALAQPFLGPAGDLLGKTRVIVVGLVVLAASSFAGGFSTDYLFLLITRVVAGISAAAVSPVAFALAADMLAPHERQVGIGRVLFASIFGQLVGAVGAGFLGDLVGWRGVLIAGGFGVVAAGVIAPLGFRGVVERRSGSPDIATAIANYRAIFANPRAKVCYLAVFFEGISVHGVMPYVAPLLAAAGERRATIAGLVIAGFAVGGASYAISVGPLISRFGSPTLMITGGAIAGASLLAVGFTPPWQAQALAIAALGFGFFMLHNAIQVQMLELAPHARGSAVAMHAFSLFIGQALGPVIYGFSLPALGNLPTTAAAGAIMLTVGILCARYLGAPPLPAAKAPSA
jgi:predicted MFS family arabinose efflux permease